MSENTEDDAEREALPEGVSVDESSRAVDAMEVPPRNDDAVTPAGDGAAASTGMTDHDDHGDGGDGVEPYLTGAVASTPSVIAPREEVSSAPTKAPTRWTTSVAALVVAALLGGVVGGVTVHLTTASNSTNANLPVTTDNSTPASSGSTGGLTIPQLVVKVQPSVVSIDVKGQGTEDQGTGMIISRDGLVVTNNHVIAAQPLGAVPKVTDFVIVWLPRTNFTVMLSPGCSEEIRLETSWALAMTVPLMATMMSPCLMPALAAPEPGTTLMTTAPLVTVKLYSACRVGLIEEISTPMKAP